MWVRLFLKLLQQWDRLRLVRLARRHPGLQIDPTASTNLAKARFELAPGARLSIGANVHSERMKGQICFHVEEGARIEVGAGTWLRCEVAPIRLAAHREARIVLGPDCFLNGCHLTAMDSIEIGEGVMIGTGTRIYDSDHAIDDARPPSRSPVRVGEFTWIASDATVLQGVEIGGHCVIGARSVVTRSIPPNTSARGIPARPQGPVGKRRAFM